MFWFELDLDIEPGLNAACFCSMIVAAAAHVHCQVSPGLAWSDGSLLFQERVLFERWAGGSVDFKIRFQSQSARLITLWSERLHLHCQTHLVRDFSCLLRRESICDVFFSPVCHLTQFPSWNRSRGRRSWWCQVLIFLIQFDRDYRCVIFCFADFSLRQNFLASANGGPGLGSVRRGFWKTMLQPGSRLGERKSHLQTLSLWKWRLSNDFSI